MTTLSPAQVYSLARDAGLSPANAVTATAIAMAESGLRTDAVGDTTITTGTWGPSVGLWQVRSLKAEAGTGRSRDATRLTEPAFNARAMVAISGGGDNWRPWSVFTSGAFRSKVPQVAAIAPALEAQAKASGGWKGLVEAVTGGVGDVGGAIVASAAGLNPFAGWQDDVQGIALKIAAVAAAGALIVVGLLRLVTPAAVGAVKALT